MAATMAAATGAPTLAMIEGRSFRFPSGTVMDALVYTTLVLIGSAFLMCLYLSVRRQFCPVFVDVSGRRQLGGGTRRLGQIDQTRQPQPQMVYVQQATALGDDVIDSEIGLDVRDRTSTTAAAVQHQEDGIIISSAAADEHDGVVNPPRWSNRLLDALHGSAHTITTWWRRGWTRPNDTVQVVVVTEPGVAVRPSSTSLTSSNNIAADIETAVGLPVAEIQEVDTQQSMYAAAEYRFTESLRHLRPSPVGFALMRAL
jgi:hypothetical protein